MDPIRCPKCKSPSTYVVTSRHPWLIGKTDETLICKVCGTRVYGTEKVDGLRQAKQLEQKKLAEAAARREEALRREQTILQLEAAKKLAEERARLDAEKAKIVAASIRAAEEARRLEAKKQAIIAQAKCAWPPCQNDHTSTSKYCSRSCNNNSARARHKERKAALKASASQA